MRYTTISGCVAILVAWIVTGASIARADSISASFTGEQYQTLISLKVTPTDGVPAYSASGYIGGYLWKQDLPNNNTRFNNSFMTFCIEINQDISTASTQNPYTFNVVDLTSAPDPGIGIGQMDSAQATEMRQLWGQDYSKITNADTANIFQFAVWQIVYGSTLSSTSTDSHGNYFMSDASSLLSNLDRSATGAQDANLVALSSSTAQDQITDENPLPPAPAPLPAAASMGVALLGGIAVLRGLGSRRQNAV